MCVLIFSTNLSKTFLILRRIQRDIVIDMKTSCKVPVILIGFCWNLDFLYWFSKKNPIPNLIKILPVGAELFHTHRRTDGRTEGHTGMTKLMVALKNLFASSESNLRRPKLRRSRLNRESPPLICNYWLNSIIRLISAWKTIIHFPLVNIWMRAVTKMFLLE
jgi:hypothetical protein